MSRRTMLKSLSYITISFVEGLWGKNICIAKKNKISSVFNDQNTVRQTYEYRQNQTSGQQKLN